MTLSKVCDEGIGGGLRAAGEMNVCWVMGGEAEDGFAAEAYGAACYEDDFASQGRDCGGVECGGNIEE